MSSTRGSEHLIIQTAFLGDLLLGIPFFREFRRMYPDAKITLLCRKGLGDFMRRSGLFSEVIEADKSSRQEWRKTVALLRARQFDLVISPHESPRTAFLVRRLRAQKKIGYRRWFNRFIFDDRVERPMHLPEALRQLALLAPLEDVWQACLEEFAQAQVSAGGQGPNDSLIPVPEWADMKIPGLHLGRLDRSPSLFSPAPRAIAEKLSGPFVCLAPGSVWPTKMWTKEGFAEVARRFLSEGKQVLLIGAPAEKSICDEIVQMAPGAHSVAGQLSLYESAELLARAELLVCNDSGAMHMAAAAGVPTVSVFGPTVLEFGYRPWQDHAVVVQVPRASLKCRPCGSHGAKECPIGTHECMSRVTAGEILEALQKL